MKKSFPGYFVLSEAEFKKLWEKCIFCIDANILLNLYRYSNETRLVFLDLLKNIKSRLWISHQAANEYLENRLGVISDQRKAYDEMIITLSTIMSDFKNARKHPFIESDLFSELDAVYEKVKSKLEINKRELDDQLENDSLLNEIASLLEEKVGAEYTSAELKAIYKEGEERYKLKIPPGFKDSSKGSEIIPNKIYGDLIIWKQLLDKAKKDNVSMVFITDDKKEDWWRIFNGKTIGPRPELIKEFQNYTNQLFYMYQPDRFMELAAKHLSKAVKAEAIREVQDVRKENERLSAVAMQFSDEDRIFHLRSLDKLKEQYSLDSRKMVQLQALLDSVNAPDADPRMIEAIRKNLSDISTHQAMIRERIKTLQKNLTGGADVNESDWESCAL